jgi:hypothetical protein
LRVIVFYAHPKRNQRGSKHLISRIDGTSATTGAQVVQLLAENPFELPTSDVTDQDYGIGGWIGEEIYWPDPVSWSAMRDS